MGFFSLHSAMRGLWWKRSGNPSTAELAGVDYAFDNNAPMYGQNAAGTANLEILRVGDTDKVRVAKQTINPLLQTYTFKMETNASIVDQVFFIAPYAMKVEKIEVIYATADGVAKTATIRKMADGVALANGTDVCSAFDLNATVNTKITATLSTTTGVLNLAYKDRLGLKLSAAVGSLAKLCITITFSPGCSGDFAVFNMQANGDIATQAFYISNTPRKVSAILYAHGAAGTDAGAVNMQVTKDTSTNAPGAGTVLLTNNTNAGFNCKGTINTVQIGALATTAGLKKLIAGDRLAVKTAGTLTALAGVIVVVIFEPVYDRVDIVYNLAKNANLVTTPFFIADRNYEVVAIQEVHSTAGTDAGAVNLQVAVDKETDVPGAGVSLSALNTNAGFNLKGTANTVQTSTFQALLGTPNNFILAGERLTAAYAGTLTALVGVVVTVTLKPV